MQADVVAGGGEPAADRLVEAAQRAAVSSISARIRRARGKRARRPRSAPLAPDPVEQAPSQVLLERGDALAHRGLGQAQPFPAAEKPLLSATATNASSPASSMKSPWLWEG